MTDIKIDIKRIFISSFILTIIVMTVLQIFGSHLITNEAPRGIVSFELARDLDQALKIIDSWGIQGRIFAGLDLGFDYLFLVMFSITLASGSILIAEKFNGYWKSFRIIGYAMAIGSVMAGLLDAVENYALIQILVGNGSDFLAGLAFWCAVPKFILVGIAITYILIGGLCSLIFKKRFY
jgi:hypothetical protein